MIFEETGWISLFAWGALVLPFVSFIVCYLIPSRFEWTVHMAASFLLFASFICAAVVFQSVWSQEPVLITWNWFTVDEIENTGQFKLDNLSVLMLVLVTFIALLVHIYSAGYMAGDAGLKRYFAMLGFFTFSMLGIVLSNHFLVTFFFWELVGFSSYLLIGHWYQKEEAGAAAIKAFIFNRIGDAGFLIGIGIIWAHSHSLQFDTVSHAAFAEPWLTWAGLFIFCGVIGKSAQFPLFTWLPDAMEGPTPVSALIHAATMVAAGVYLMARVYFLFTSITLTIIACVGAITAIWGAWGALREFDMKKILAYSTVSQLGFMILGMGSGSFSGSIMHLFTHAFFKAGLFLAAGAIIHYLHRIEHHTHENFDVQDIRNMGGLRKHLPNTFLVFILAGASLAGIPFFSGFISKDVLLTQLYNSAVQQGGLNWVILIIAFFISFLTVFYTFRLIWFIFFGECRIADKIEKAKEETVPTVLIIPMSILGICSLWIVTGWNPVTSGWLQFGLGEVMAHNNVISLLSAVWIIIAVLISYFVFRSKKEPWTPVPYFFNPDTLYKRIFEKPVYQLSLITLTIDKRLIDRGIHFVAYLQVTLAHFIGWCDRVVVDGSVHGMARMAGGLGSMTRSLAGGKIQSYILWAMLGLIIFILWILLYS